MREFNQEQKNRSCRFFGTLEKGFVKDVLGKMSGPNQPITQYQPSLRILERKGFVKTQCLLGKSH